MAPPALFEGFPFNAFRRATPAQLLAFLKILGVEQRQVAASLGVSFQLVSFWIRGARPIPKKYRWPLHRLALDAYHRAIAKHEQATAALPTAVLRHTADAAFQAPIVAWAEGVFYESGLAEQTLRQALKRLRQYEDLDTWTAADLEEMGRLCMVLEVKIRGMQERQAETDPEARYEKA